MLKIFANLFARVNPSMDSAYEQLEASLTAVFKHVSGAIEARDHLEQQIKKNDAQALVWLERSEKATQQGNEQLNIQSLQRQKQYLQSSSELQELLPKLIRGNNRLLRILAKCQSAVLRLYIVKVLLQALSRESKAETADFEQVAAALVSNIKKALGSQQLNDASLEFIVTRINDLQDHVFESYKFLMQGDISQLTRTDQLLFLERITKAVEDIQCKLSDSVSLWHEILEGGALNEDELTDSMQEREHLTGHVSSVVQLLEELAARLKL